MTNDELSLCCVDYRTLIGKKLCCNVDNGGETKCSCLVELTEDDDLVAVAATMLRVHSRRDELMRKEYIYEWEQNVSVRSLID